MGITMQKLLADLAKLEDCYDMCQYWGKIIKMVNAPESDITRAELTSFISKKFVKLASPFTGTLGPLLGGQAFLAMMVHQTNRSRRHLFDSSSLMDTFDHERGEELRRMQYSPKKRRTMDEKAAELAGHSLPTIPATSAKRELEPELIVLLDTDKFGSFEELIEAARNTVQKQLKEMRESTAGPSMDEAAPMTQAASASPVDEATTTDSLDEVATTASMDEAATTASMTEAANEAAYNMPNSE